MNKLALGTVQFGLDYGINNKSGQTSKAEIEKILDLAFSSGIDCLDTAQAYGDSETILGEVLNDGKKFNIISKLDSKNIFNVCSSFEISLKNLRVSQLYGFLYHDFNSYKNNVDSIKYLLDYKSEGKINKIGFSLYYPDQLEFLFNENIPVDLIQVPYNIFDRRFESFFQEAQKRDIEIHIRSVFLQGCFFLNPDHLPSFLSKIKNKIEKLRKLSEQNKISLNSLCLNFVNINEYIDKIIIGVDTQDNLRDNIEALNEVEEFTLLKNEMFDLQENDEKILLPFNWGKE